MSDTCNKSLVNKGLSKDQSLSQNGFITAISDINGIRDCLTTQLPSHNNNVIPLAHPNIGKIVFKDSEKNHVGTKIIAQNVTIVNVEEETKVDGLNSGSNGNKKTKGKKYFFKRFWSKDKVLKMFTICSVIVILSVVGLVLMVELKPNEPYSNSDVTQKPTTFPTSSEWPPFFPTGSYPTHAPEDRWFFSYTEWSHQAPMDPCGYYNISAKSTLVVDSTDSSPCVDISSCINTLISLEKAVLQYNYLIGGDGRVYEVWGNSCPPEMGLDANALIKIAFIGDYHELSNNTTLNNLEKNVFRKFMYKLNYKRQLNNNYIIYPQCCRDQHYPGPGKIVLDFIEGEFFRNYKPCYNVDKMCI